MRFRLIEAEKTQHPVSLLCSVLGVSRAGYYSWRSRSPSRRALADDRLARLIARVFTDSHETYGAPRIQAELADDHGLGFGRKRVARLMRELALAGVSRRRKGLKTTVQTKEAPVAADLVRRQFRPSGPDRLWVADITYVSSWEGYVFLACVIDAWSRKGRRLVDARRSSLRAGRRCARDGAEQAKAETRPRPPLRSGLAVHEPRLR